MIMVQMSIEYYQVKNKLGFCKGLKDHFLKGWNVLDMTQLVSTTTITIVNLPSGESPNKTEQRIVAAFSLFLLWYKLYDWL